RAVHLRHQRRWHLHQRHAPQIRSRHKSRHIPHHAAAHRHQQRFPVRARPHQLPRQQLHRRQILRRLRIVKQMHHRRRTARKTSREHFPHRSPHLRRTHHMHAGKPPHLSNLPPRPPQQPRRAHHPIAPRPCPHPHSPCPSPLHLCRPHLSKF